jgi:hypothetical protein
MLANEIIKKNQSKKILQCKQKYNNKKRIRFDRKKLKNDEIEKKKTVVKTI